MSCYSEKACKGNKILCNLHAFRAKTAIIYVYLTIILLLSGLFVVKSVDIDISACLFRGIAEEAELGAHEEAAPVEAEAIVLGADLRPLLTVEAIGEAGAVGSTHATHACALSRTEVGIDAKPDSRLFQFNALDGLLLDLRHLLVAIGEFHLQLFHLQEEFLTLLLDGQRTRFAVEGCQSGTVAILHLREVHDDATATRWSLHTLSEGVRSQVDVLDHTVGLQAQESWTVRETPCGVDGVVVPLPVQTKFRIREVVGLDDGRFRLAADEGPYGVGHLSVFITKHRPAVDPAAGHHCQHAAHATTILEDDAVPVATGTVDDGSLCLIAEAAELTLEDDLFLVGAVDIVGTIAHLPTVLAWGIDV